MEKDANIWSEKDVSDFLLFNQCATYCGVFLSQVINMLKIRVFCSKLFCIYFISILYIFIFSER